MKIGYSEFYGQLKNTPLEPWIELLPERIAHGLRYERYGLLPRWEEALAQLPELKPSAVALKSEVRVEGEAFAGLEELLKAFHPWRKGPYRIHGVHINTEWRSDWKWDRVVPHIQPLEGRTVLDIGCGNGYHCWRMAGEGAKLVVGVDPSPMFICQFFAMKNFIRDPRAWVLPIGIEDVPETPQAFDTVFSMGVLYHRKSPGEHIEQLKSFLRPGGELVLETLVIDGPGDQVLVPECRYAKMRNVWSIPSIPTLEGWLHDAGLENIRRPGQNRRRPSRAQTRSCYSHRPVIQLVQ